MGAATRFCLVRHGETPWNAERRIQGQTDIGLSDTGLAQATLAGRALAGQPVAALYSSDLTRARSTAERIGACLGLAPVLAPQFRERRYGIFEGLTYDQARAQHPDAYRAFETRDPAYGVPGGGESLVQMRARVAPALETLAQAHPGELVVLVTHGGVLDILNRYLRALPLEAPRDFQIPNAGFNWVRREGAGWVVEAWACTAHLTPGSLDELANA